MGMNVKSERILFLSYPLRGLYVYKNYVECCVFSVGRDVSLLYKYVKEYT